MNSPLADEAPDGASCATRGRGGGGGGDDGRRERTIEKGPLPDNADPQPRQLLADCYTNILQTECHDIPGHNDLPISNTVSSTSDLPGLAPSQSGDLVLDVYNNNNNNNNNNNEEEEPASNYGFEYLKYYQEDLCWSSLSDLFFLVGSLFYLAKSYFEVYGRQESSRSYDVINILAPFLYLLNSVVDIHWAVLVQRRPKDLRRRTEQMTAGLWRTGDSYTSGGGRLPLRPPLGPSSSSWASSILHSNSSVVVSGLDDPQHEQHQMLPSSSLTCSFAWCQRFFRYAAHRRTLYAAATFGLAALLSVVAVLSEFEPVNDNQEDDEEEEETSGVDGDETTLRNNKVADILYTVSDHVYVISAVIALTGRRVRPWFASTGSIGAGPLCGMFHEPEALEDMGDILFLLGCLFDAMLDNLALKAIPSLGAVSSSLWLVDALLYLQSDFVMARRLRDIDSDFMNSPLV